MAFAQKYLVIDTDIITAASHSNKKRPAICNRFLETVLLCRHYTVRSPELNREWKKRSSKWSDRWLSRMYVRDLVVDIPDSYNEGMRRTIETCAESESVSNIMLKDVHLLEAALQSDKIVASLDKTAQKHFANVCQHIGEIKEVMWVNPETEADSCIVWLKKGAPVEPERQLGHRVRP